MSKYDELTDIIQEYIGISSIDNVKTYSKSAYYYYEGRRGDKRTAGKSIVVSTDVADSLNWIMPELVKTYAGNDEVVDFEPVDSSDVRQASIESRYVYNTIMNNGGYDALHSTFFDALLQRNGVIKVSLGTKISTFKETIEEITDEELDAVVNALTANDVEHNVIKPGKNKTTIKAYKEEQIIKFESIAPELFVISDNHNSLSLENARFCGDTSFHTKSELEDLGYDTTDVKFDSGKADDDSSYRREDDNTTCELSPVGLADVLECYIRYDQDGDGHDELLKVVMANPGHTSGIILDIEEVDHIPYFAGSAWPLPHKFYGQSVYDKTKEIQDHNTALLRSVMDNIYLTNNQRTVALENMVNLDDLLLNRPGSIIRAKSLNAVAPMPVAPLSDMPFTMLAQNEKMRKSRVGVSAEGVISDDILNSNSGSQGIQAVMDQSAELVGLAIRNFGEYLIKPLCLYVHRLLRESGAKPEMFNDKNNWLPIQPSTWPERSRISVKVGSGNGDKRQKMSFYNVALNTLMALKQAGDPNVTGDSIHALLSDMGAVTGVYNIDPFYPNPDGNDDRAKIAKLQQALVMKDQEAQQMIAQVQQQTQQSIEAAQAEATIKLANAEQQNSITQRQNTQFKAEAENAKLENQRIKDQYELQLKGGELQLDRDKATTEAGFRDREVTVEEGKLALEMGKNNE